VRRGEKRQKKITRQRERMKEGEREKKKEREKKRRREREDNERLVDLGEAPEILRRVITFLTETAVGSGRSLVGNTLDRDHLFGSFTEVGQSGGLGMGFSSHV
jgi:hypothetical protein